MAGKAKKKKGLKKATRKVVKKAVRGDMAGGIIGQFVPQVNQVAKDLMREILPNLLAFPTSGASAMASPNLALGGYNSSMALSAPAANGTYVKHNKARMRSNKSGMSVRHREYVQDITFGTPGDFNNMVALPINPGNRELFPWLSGISTRFETYRFNRLCFIYEPQCGTDNEGTVMMAVDFDAVDPPPVDKLQFMTYDGAVRSPPWFAGKYECAPYNLHKYKEYYITSELSTPTSTDEKTYYVGNIYVATQSQSTPFTAGELYVEYDVTLSTPQLDNIQSVAGYITQASRSVAGAYTPIYATGELNPMINYFFPNSIASADYLIPNPGGYIVIIIAQAVDDLGVFNVTIGTTINPPPTGGSVAGELFLFGEGGSGAGVAAAIHFIVNLNDPVWFTVTSSFSLAMASTTISLLILPVDTTALRFLGPFATPPVNPLMSRFEAFCKRKAVQHMATHRSEIKHPVLTLEEVKTTKKDESKPKPFVFPIKTPSGA
jgi:hypothetical protein